MEKSYSYIIKKSMIVFLFIGIILFTFAILLFVVQDLQFYIQQQYMKTLNAYEIDNSILNENVVINQPTTNISNTSIPDIEITKKELVEEQYIPYEKHVYSMY